MKVEDLPDLSARRDRRAGALLGLGTGDSLGATHEFRRPEDVPEGPLEVVGGGEFRWKAGAPTDHRARPGRLGGLPRGPFRPQPCQGRDAPLARYRPEGHRQPDP